MASPQTDAERRRQAQRRKGMGGPIHILGDDKVWREVPNTIGIPAVSRREVLARFREHLRKHRDERLEHFRIALERRVAPSKTAPTPTEPGKPAMVAKAPSREVVAQARGLVEQGDRNAVVRKERQKQIIARKNDARVRGDTEAKRRAADELHAVFNNAGDGSPPAVGRNERQKPLRRHWQRRTQHGTHTVHRRNFWR